jgi:hypothetical protein
VLEALADALRLDEAERAHLFALARESGARSNRRTRTVPTSVRPPIQQVLDAMTDARLEAGRTPHDKALIELVGELSIRSELFALVGLPTMCSSTAAAASDSATRPLASSTSTSSRWSSPPCQGLVLNVYTAAAGSPSADTLKLLASWAASQEGLPTEFVAATRASSREHGRP